MITALTSRFGVDVPVVQAPMAGAAGGRLAGAVSAAGALGMIGVGPTTEPDWIREQHAIAVASAGDHPFGIGVMDVRTGQSNGSRSWHARRQEISHPSLPTKFPSSHSSPVFTRPSGHEMG